MIRKSPYILFVFFLVLLVFGLGTRIVSAGELTEETASDVQKIQSEAEEAILSEFDFSQIEDSLKSMFPTGKISFEEVLKTLISGNLTETGKIFLAFLSDQIWYEFTYNRKSLVYIIMAALTAAVFSNFAGAFRSRQISDISFYVIYMLLITLCLTSFRTSVEGLEERLEGLMDFMQVLCPTYFMAVAIASGSMTAIFFYNVILMLIYVVELVIVRFLLPVINIYIMVLILGNLTGEDFLSELADLIHRAVLWILRSMLAGVVGINVVQGLLAPVIDSLRRSALTRTAEALPWIGNALGGAAEIVLGMAVLLKNGIGMAGAVIAVAVCAVPVLQMLITALMYKLAAALVQPVSDKRITSCISGISEGYEILVRVLFTAGILFLVTIVIVAVSTS